MIRTKRKTLYLDDKCINRCNARFKVKKCTCFDPNKGFNNKFILGLKLKSIELSDFFELEKKIVKLLHFYWNSKTIVLDIPHTIKFIQYSSDQNIIPYLPSDLEHLVLGPKFNHPVSNLPIKLKTIKFGASFNQDVSNLPWGLEKIHFSTGKFDYPIDMLPETLVYVELPSNYDKDISNLPNSIEVISLNLYYKSQPDKLNTIKLFENKIVWRNNDY